METPVPTRKFDRIVRTVCSPNCLGTCGVNAFVKDDKIVKLEPAAFPEEGFERICLKGIAMAMERVHHDDRLRYPMIRAGERGQGAWRRVSWDEAYAFIADKLSRVSERYGARANAWYNGSGNYAWRSRMSVKRMANQMEGTHFTSGGLTSDLAGHLAFIAAFGTSSGANDLAEAKGMRYMLNIGKNIADTGHSEMHFLFDAMEAGCKLVVVDPRFSKTAAKADEWVPVQPGTDTVLAMALINVVITGGLIDVPYICRYTNLPFLVRCDTGAVLRERDFSPTGSASPMVWDEAKDKPVPVTDTDVPRLSASGSYVCHTGETIAFRTAYDLSWENWQRWTPEYAASICGITAAQIRHIAHEYTTMKPASIWLGLGPQRYNNGHNMFRAFITLGALCGNIGKTNSGVSFVDGGVARILGGGANHEWLKPGGKVGHSLSGTAMMDIILSGEPYPIKSLWITASGFAVQTPYFKRFRQEALAKLDLFVVTDNVMTEAAEYADVVLPCVSYYEDDWDIVPGGEIWFVQIRRRAVSPVGDSRNDYDIFKGLCEHLGDAEHWQLDPKEDCRQILARHPLAMFREVDWDVLARDGVARIPIKRPHVPFEDLKFNTPSGRIELYQEQFASQGEALLVNKEAEEVPWRGTRADLPMRLITYKHAHSVHSIHTILPSVREMLPEPRLEISQADADARGIADLDEVEVYNDRGQFRVRATISQSVVPGMLAMTEGWWRRHFTDGHPSDLSYIPHNEVQARIGEVNWAAWDFGCNVRKA